MIYDAVVAAVSHYLVSLVILRSYGLTPSLAAAVVAALAAVAGGNILGLYERRTLVGRITLLITLFGTAALVILSLVVFKNLVFYEQIGRRILFFTGVVFIVLIAFPRVLGHYAVHLYKIRILAISDRKRAEDIARCLEMEEDCYVFAGYCSDRKEDNPLCIGVLEDIPALCRERNIDQVVVTGRYVDNPTVLEQGFLAARLRCEVQDECAFYEDFLEQVQIGSVAKGVFFSARIGRSSRSVMFIKRAMDIGIALFGLVLIIPFFPLIWILTRYSSGASAIYTQERCGRFGKPFNIYKFRTMRLDAESKGARWASDGDARVTPIGRILRKTRLDEFPQFWNILKGEMSFVGPRPEQSELVHQIEKSVPYFSFRHWARPGLTGLAQIRFRYSATMEDTEKKLCYDLYYIKNWSLFMDVQIILRSISSIMKGSR